MGREEERKGKRRTWVRSKRKEERGKNRREDMHFCLKESVFNISLFPKLMQSVANITISPIV